MAKYKAEFLKYLDKEGIKYRNFDDDFGVSIGYNCKNIKDIDVTVIFDEDGEGKVALRSWSLGKVQDSKFTAMLKTLNELNHKYRWVKFSVDDDQDIEMSTDAVIDLDTVGEEVTELMHRMVSIGDEAYPAIMKALWG